MSKRYTFEPLEGDNYVIAEPKDGNEDPVRLDTKWVEKDDVEAGWERPIGALIKSDLLSDMDLKDGNGEISRKQAVETLAEAGTEDGDPIVTSETQAEALIDYLGSEGIVNIKDDDDSVLLLQDPEATENPDMYINWAAGIDACVDKIEETEDRIEAAKNKLQSRLDDMEKDPGAIEEKIRETAQELKFLGDGEGVPDPNNLPAEKEQKYNRLKEKLVYHKKMKEVVNTDVTDSVEEGTQKLADSLDMLNSAKQALMSKQEGFRLVALQGKEVPDGAHQIVENMGSLATALAGVGDVDEKADNMSHEEVEDTVGEILEEIEPATDEMDKITEEETEQTSNTGPSMSD